MPNAVRSVPGPDGLVLASALHFAGTWDTPFTWRSDDTFHTASAAIAVPLMHLEGTLPWAATDDHQAVELPYAGGAFAMLLVVPRRRDGLAGVMASLTPQSIDATIAALAEVRVDLRLPPFSFATTLDLAGALQSLGVSAAFDRERADFSRAAAGRAARLRIDSVTQSACVRVDEEGTVAAAVTSVDFPGAGQAFDDPPKIVRADRPFLFAIRHRATGGLLFLGRVADPTR